MPNNIETPKVTLYDIDKLSYIKSLANAEKQISAYKSIARWGISNTIKQRFNIDGDCFQIFEKRSGGILFKDWEWEQIPNSNLLKQLFETNKNGLYTYCLETDEGKILRGADTYYYFLTNKGKSQDLNIDMVLLWAKNNMDFFKTAINSLPNKKVIDHNDRRLILGVLDNIRNVSLIMLNANIVRNADHNNSIIELQNQTNDINIRKWSQICKKITNNIKSLCFSEIIDDTFILDIQESLYDILDSFSENINQIYNNHSTLQLNKSFRSYREIDNYIENYIGIEYAIKKIKETNPQILNKPINFIGATYGGLELPFIASEIIDDEILTSAIILQSKYKDRNADDYLAKNLNVQSTQDFQNNYNILCDDNVLTGKTLQAMINILFSNDIPIKNIAIIRYPSINRVDQMIEENSAIDPSKFFNYIQGLVFSSPYTKIKQDRNSQYLDELGIFNKDRRRLLEYLYKNGIYSSNSEVASISEMYKGR